MNPNYVIVVKQDFDKFLNVGFITLADEVSWLSPIVFIPKKNNKLWIYVDF
jgi:hypothetical protein